MRNPIFLFLLIVLSASLIQTPAPGAGNEADVFVVIDGVTVSVGYDDLPEDLPMDPEGGLAAVDIVGETTDSATHFGRAKGNSFRIDTPVTLLESEFWLEFNDTQTLTFYVFQCPTEFGLYTDIHRHSRVVTGSGPYWYSSGALNVDLFANWHYIIAVSWNGTMTYFFGAGTSQATTFGAQTHGYAAGYDPLPVSFVSDIDDIAIYRQRLTTDYATAVEATTWGGVKALFR